jgi:hypothetical protein
MEKFLRFSPKTIITISHMLQITPFKIILLVVIGHYANCQQNERPRKLRNNPSQEHKETWRIAYLGLLFC